MNKRGDEWGGDARERTKFLREVLLGVKERIGDALALGIRINGQESREGGYDLLELREMMSHVAETGTLDFVNVDVGHCWGGPSYVQPSYYGHAVYREAGKALKVDLEGIPVLFSGRVNDPGIAEQLLEEGVLRPRRHDAGRHRGPRVRQQGARGEALGDPALHRLQPLHREVDSRRRAGHVPEAHLLGEPGGRQRDLLRHADKPAETKKRFVVVGGGAAGCEAARVAASAGTR